MTKVGIFVDDQEEVYAELLTRDGVIEFVHLPVDAGITALASQTMAQRPAVVALDYRLDENVGGLPADESYKASALAQHFRDKAVEDPTKDFSIVLVSAEDKIKALYDPDLTAHDLFDRVYVKERVTSDPDAVQDELIDLSTAYETLIAKGGRYELGALLAAREDDDAFLDVQELTLAASSASAPHQIVCFLLRNLLDKPGLLLDADDVAARLGIDHASFPNVEGKLIAAGIVYEGLLSGAWPRWWAHRLEEWCVQLFDAKPITLTSAERAEKIRAALEIEVEPARSRWTGGTDERIAVACASCRNGTEVRHSVNVFEGPMPRYRIARRICWDCVQTDRYAHVRPRLQIDDLDEAVAERVKTLEKPSAQ
jgi:hypothetical protein